MSKGGIAVKTSRQTKIPSAIGDGLFLEKRIADFDEPF
jgi:hypothetical protein